jgi:outer membrane protein assembly factor BamD (BamD/ComL family)
VRPHARRLRWSAPILLLALSACSTARPAPPGSAPAAQLVAQADDFARRGQARAALAAYERVLREHPGDPAGAGALHGQGRLQADPAGGVRNYRAAQRAYARLLAEYPESRWEADARAWQVVLADLLAREAETARLKDEAAKLKEETVRLRTQIERLRRTDLDLEGRR